VNGPAREVVSSELSRGDSGRLRIGIDGRLLGDNRTGISRYVFELCRALDRLLPAAQFFVYGPWALQMPVSSPRWIPRVDPLEPVLRRAKRQWYTKHLWMLMREGRLCREDGLHAFWATQAPFVPTMPASVRVVATVYDLQHRIRPETLRPLARVGHRLLERRLARANAIVTVSNGTAERLYHLLGYRVAAVVRPAVSREFRPRADAEVDHWVARYGIRRPYILSVASWDPRKNLELLIKSFVAMKREGLLTDYTLVLCGAKRGQIDGRLDALLNRDASDDVRFLGFIPDQSLPPLYTGASAFVFPSLYEGFGMPVLEARACGTPVVTTDLPELREAGGDDAIYVSPNEEGIRSGILTALAQKYHPTSDLSSWTWEQGAHALAMVLLEA